MSDVQQPFVIERNYDVPAAKVWQAITDPEQMRQWYFDLPGFTPVIGYEFHFEGGPEDRKYIHRCRITEVVEGRKLSYTWRYEGYEGESLVTFELIPKGESSTLLRLTHEGLHTFPASNPDLAKENFAAGWLHIIGTSLKDFLGQNATA